MPWNDKSGGGGGPWGGGGGNNQGPWGQGPKGPSGPQGSPPDLEDIIRRGQDRLRRALPGGGGASPAVFALIAAALVVLWAFKAVYTVQPDEVAVELRFGKPKALTCTLAAGLVAFGSSWWLYNPDYPLLSVVQTGLNGFSATGLWVVLPSMCVDVVDYDELESSQRREGAYSSMFSWVLKFGMSVSMLVMGPLLDNVSGFDAKLGGNQTPEAIFAIRALFTGLPVAALVAALILIQMYPLTRERMQEIRAQLEARRGTV